MKTNGPNIISQNINMIKPATCDFPRLKG